MLVEKISEKNMDLQLMPEGTKSPVSILKLVMSSNVGNDGRRLQNVGHVGKIETPNIFLIHLGPSQIMWMFTIYGIR